MSSTSFITRFRTTSNSFEARVFRKKKDFYLNVFYEVHYWVVINKIDHRSIDSDPWVKIREHISFGSNIVQEN